jgi:hypothetical protein
MTRKLLLVLIAFVMASPVLGVAPAAALTRPETFSLIDVEASMTALDPGANFSENALPVLGSRFTFVDRLYRWAGQRRGGLVGRIEGLCTFTAAEARVGVTVFCTASWHLPRGQILGAAFIRFAENVSAFRVPVIGGTGAYANARGFIEVRDLPSGNSNNKFHLSP